VPIEEEEEEEVVQDYHISPNLSKVLKSRNSCTER
jgi:hypothetical protein